MNTKNNTIAEDIVLNKIYEIRGEKVMFDRDLADIYGVETKYLKRQVRRNIDRFPEDFMFELTTIKFENWRCRFGTSNSYIKTFLKSIIPNNQKVIANCDNLLNQESHVKIQK